MIYEDSPKSPLDQPGVNYTELLLLDVYLKQAWTLLVTYLTGIIVSISLLKLSEIYPEISQYLRGSVQTEVITNQ